MIQRATRALIQRWLSRLPFSVLYEVFYQSGRALGVRSYEVAGNAGDFFGPLYDQTITKTYLRSKTWSPNLVGLLKHFFEASAGGTFYDIGANIGLITVPVAANPAVTCVAFEPDPHNYRLLQAYPSEL